MRLFISVLCLLSLVLVPELARGQPSTSPTPTSANAFSIKQGQQIVFLGDSMTQSGWNTASGFIHLVTLGLTKENVQVKASQVGAQGNRAQELFDLYQKNIATMTPKADWLVLSCGLDEVSRNLPGSDVETFQQTMKSIIDAAKGSGTQVMILTTSLANERDDGAEKRLDPYNNALRALAKDEGCLLADINAVEVAALPTAPMAPGNQKLLQGDGPLNTHGQRLVASEILKTFGVSAAQLTEIEQAWLDAPKSAGATANVTRLKGTAALTLREYNALETAAAAEHHTVADMLNAKYTADVIVALRAANASSDVASIQKTAQASFEKDVTDLLKTVPPPPAAAPGSPKPATPPANVLITSGQKLAFMGDSITQFGFQHPYGYVNLIIRGLATVGVQTEPVPAGVSGNTSRDMLKRLQTSVLDKKPDWMTLSCGVNDVWHGITGCDLDTYKKNITSIVDQAQQAKIQVVILTATMIQESENPLNDKLAPYNDFLRSLAKERKFPLADLNEAEHEALKAIPADSPYKHLTVDGVHMNPHGDQMMAVGVLKALGLTDPQLAQVKEQWLDDPNGASVDGSAVFAGGTVITLRESDALEQLAIANKQLVADYLTPIYVQALIEQAKSDPAQVDFVAMQSAAQTSFAQKVAELIKNPPAPTTGK